MQDDIARRSPGPSSVSVMSEDCQNPPQDVGETIAWPCPHHDIRVMLRRAAPRPHALLLALLLVGTLALATMLAYVAHDAARSHRATAERALHDYAAVAAWELVAGVNEEMQSSLGSALGPMTRARATTPYE